MTLSPSDNDKTNSIRLQPRTRCWWKHRTPALWRNCASSRDALSPGQRSRRLSSPRNRGKYTDKCETAYWRETQNVITIKSPTVRNQFESEVEQQASRSQNNVTHASRTIIVYANESENYMTPNSPPSHQHLCRQVRYRADGSHQPGGGSVGSHGGPHRALPRPRHEGRMVPQWKGGRHRWVRSRWFVLRWAVVDYTLVAIMSGIKIAYWSR